MLKETITIEISKMREEIIEILGIEENLEIRDIMIEEKGHLTLDLEAMILRILIAEEEGAIVLIRDQDLLLIEDKTITDIKDKDTVDHLFILTTIHT